MAKKLDWNTLKTLDFQQIDHDRFPAIELAKHVIEHGGSAGATLNAANEIAVEAFMNQQIRFGDIARIVKETLHALPTHVITTLSDVEAADQNARRHARTLITHNQIHSPQPAGTQPL